MTHKKTKIILYFQAAALAFSLALLPAMAQAQSSESCDILKAQFEEAGKIDKVGDAINSLPAYCTVGSLLTKILNYGFIFAGSVAALFIIIGGLQYMTSGGNEEQAKKGKKTLTYAVVGLVIVLLSVTGVRLITGLLTNTSSSGGGGPPGNGGGPPDDATGTIKFTYTGSPVLSNTRYEITVKSDIDSLKAACGSDASKYVAHAKAVWGNGQVFGETNIPFVKKGSLSNATQYIATQDYDVTSGDPTTIQISDVTVCGKHSS